MALCLCFTMLFACDNKKTEDDDNVSSEISEESEFFEVKAENISFYLPSSWGNIENLNADVFENMYANNDYTRFLGLIAENKKNLAKDVDLAKYAELVKSQMAKNAGVSELSALEERTSENGIEKINLQFELKVEDVEFYYYLSVFEKDNKFYQMLFWTSKEFRESSKDIFENISSTLK